MTQCDCFLVNVGSVVKLWSSVLSSQAETLSLCCHSAIISSVAATAFYYVFISCELMK